MLAIDVFNTKTPVNAYQFKVRRIKNNFLLLGIKITLNYKTNTQNKQIIYQVSLFYH